MSIWSSKRKKKKIDGNPEGLFFPRLENNREVVAIQVGPYNFPLASVRKSWDVSKELKLYNLGLHFWYCDGAQQSDSVLYKRVGASELLPVFGFSPGCNHIVSQRSELLKLEVVF